MLIDSATNSEANPWTLDSYLCHRGMGSSCNVANAQLGQILRLFQNFAGQRSGTLGTLFRTHLGYPVLRFMGRKHVSSQLLHRVTLHPSHQTILSVRGLSTIFQLNDLPENPTTRAHLHAFHLALTNFITRLQADPELEGLLFSFSLMPELVHGIIRIIIRTFVSGVLAAILAFLLLILFKRRDIRWSIVFLALAGVLSSALVVTFAFGFVGYIGAPLVFASLFPPLAVFLHSLHSVASLLSVWVAHAHSKPAHRSAALLHSQSPPAAAALLLALLTLLLLPLAPTPALRSLCQLLPPTLAAHLVHSILLFPALLALSSRALPTHSKTPSNSTLTSTLPCCHLGLASGLASCVSKWKPEWEPRSHSNLRLLLKILRLSLAIITPVLLLLGASRIKLDFSLADFFPRHMPIRRYMQVFEADILNRHMIWNGVVLKSPDFENVTQFDRINDFFQQIS